MFVIDAFIGNRDRNLDNFGFLQDCNGMLHLAPVYDCGSSLSALVSIPSMIESLNNENKFKREEFNIYSCFRENRNKILVSEIFKKPPEGLAKAILNIVPKIDMKEIKNIIKSTEGIEDIQKEYIMKSLKLRKELILDRALKKIKRAKKYDLPGHD